MWQFPFNSGPPSAHSVRVAQRDTVGADRKFFIILVIVQWKKKK